MDSHTTFAGTHRVLPHEARLRQTNIELRQRGDERFEIRDRFADTLRELAAHGFFRTCNLRIRGVAFTKRFDRRIIQVQLAEKIGRRFANDADCGRQRLHGVAHDDKLAPGNLLAPKCFCNALRQPSVRAIVGCLRAIGILTCGPQPLVERFREIKAEFAGSTRFEYPRKIRPRDLK